jgi:hypothetical protein
MFSHVFLGVIDLDRSLRFSGLRPHHHDNDHGVYFRDPEANKLCVVCHAPAANDA